jgi:hypothetical protein
MLLRLKGKMQGATEAKAVSDLSVTKVPANQLNIVVPLFVNISVAELKG